MVTVDVNVTVFATTGNTMVFDEANAVCPIAGVAPSAPQIAAAAIAWHSTADFLLNMCSPKQMS
jgi:hypothetical protein